MTYLKKAIEVFERIKQAEYIIQLNKQNSIKLIFKDEHFHHLFGLHKLDLTLPIGYKSKSRVYEYLKLHHRAFENEIENKMAKSSHVKNKIKYFEKLERLLSSENLKMVDISQPNIGSVIVAKYVLYDNEEGIHLLLTLVNNDDYYVPTSWMVDIGREPHIIKGKKRMLVKILK